MALARLLRRRARIRTPLIPAPAPAPAHSFPISPSRPSSSLYSPYLNVPGTRPFSAEAVSHPSNRVQIYISRHTDPYLNLSIEHFLLQRSGPDSVVLFLYANRPCVVIGRNQNPWVEVNLGLVNEPGVLARLRSGGAAGGGAAAAAAARVDGRGESGIGRNGKDENDDVLLVRRRSGGGTVFHDRGNMNYSVICPPAAFDRNRHAEMVVRALRTLGVPSVRVNERHDIVLDVPTSTSTPPPNNDPPAGPGPGPGPGGSAGTYKISGSAYKLTRLRSLHHGTCLLASPNLPFVGRLLRSPAAPYIKARGVESVRSPIRNVGVPNAAFEDAVVAEFGAMYGNVDAEALGGGDGGDLVGTAEGEGEALLEDVPEIARGYAELRSLNWIYAQTPQFTFASHATDEDPRPRPCLPKDVGLPLDFRAGMTVRHGQITDASGTSLPASLNSVYLHRVEDWRSKTSEPVGKWLNGLFGVGGGKGQITPLGKYKT